MRRLVQWTAFLIQFSKFSKFAYRLAYYTPDSDRLAANIPTKLSISLLACGNERNQWVISRQEKAVSLLACGNYANE